MRVPMIVQKERSRFSNPLTYKMAYRSTVAFIKGFALSKDAALVEIPKVRPDQSPRTILNAHTLAPLVK